MLTIISHPSMRPKRRLAVVEKVGEGKVEEGANAPPFCSKFERPSSPVISVERIGLRAETCVARPRQRGILCPVAKFGYWRRLVAGHLLGVLEPSVIFPRRSLCWLPARCMQEACARRVEVLMTTAASAAIVIRIRAVNVYKFSLDFANFPSIF